MFTQWRLTFRDTGNMYEGTTATEVLRRLSKEQFTPEAKKNIKDALSWRAWTLGFNLDETKDDESFLIDFAGTGLASLEVKDGSKGWLTY